jgi:hypothetical protein
MGKRDKVKPAAGLGATSGNIEDRLVSARKATPARRQCTNNCANLQFCRNNIRECPGLANCGINVVPCQLAAR